MRKRELWSVEQDDFTVGFRVSNVRLHYYSGRQIEKRCVTRDILPFCHVEGIMVASLCCFTAIYCTSNLLVEERLNCSTYSKLLTDSGTIKVMPSHSSLNIIWHPSLDLSS